MWAHDFLSNKKQREEIMTDTFHSDDRAESAAPVVGRRDMLRGAAAIAATALIATDASARDFGRNAEPQRYPDPDIVVIDAKRFKAKVGNTSIKR
jgi:gluconolactonase